MKARAPLAPGAAAKRKRSQKFSAISDTTPQTVIPNSSAEIREVLLNQASYSSPVRPMGSGSSTTRCSAASGGTIVRMEGLNRILNISDTTATVQPGVRIGELAEALAERNLELIGSLDLADRSVGGAVSAPTLDAAMPADGGQFAAHVESMKVITPSGQRLEVNDKNPRMLTMFRLSYGLLGIVHEITLKVRPIQPFEVHTRKTDFAGMSGLIQQLSRVGAGVRFCLLPFKNRVYLEMRRPQDSGSRSGSPGTWRVKDWAVNSALPGVARTLAKSIPFKQLRYPLMDSLGEATQTFVGAALGRNGSNASEQTGRLKRLDLAPKFSSVSWAFPAAQFPRALGGYRSFNERYYAQTGFRCDLPAIGHRLNADKSALLSPSYTGPQFAITTLCAADAGWDDYLLNLDDLARGYGGVPFFNQTKGLSVATAQAAYGSRLQFFRKVRHELDPDDRMINQFFASFVN